jgi:hypothetical protein
MRSQIYEITLAGQAGSLLCAAFEDCQVTVASGTTTLRAELPDQPAVMELLERIAGFGLELIEMRLVAPPPRPMTDGFQASRRPATMPGSKPAAGWLDGRG